MTNQVSPLMASTRSIWLFLQEEPFSLIVWADATCPDIQRLPFTSHPHKN